MTQISDVAVVPVEPTEEMLKAGALAAQSAYAHHAPWDDDAKGVWGAMLAAAPQALANRDAPGSGLGSSAKADPHRAAEGGVVAVPRAQLVTLCQSMALRSLQPGEGETLINCWIKAHDAEAGA